MPFKATAMKAGLMSCHDCGKLLKTRETVKNEVLTCPRCNAEIHFRKPHSLTRVWALIITSILLFIPANLLPIMRVNFLGTMESSTIMDGIIYFFHEGEYLIGLIIFTASILVPIFKIIGMIIILLSISRVRLGFCILKNVQFYQKLNVFFLTNK